MLNTFELAVAEKLENLVHRRFDAIPELEFYLEYLDIKTKLEESVDSVARDYNLIGHFENDDVYCDFDIYYLLDKKFGIYITEVGYEFE